MENIIDYLNPFGRYQKLLLIYIGLPSAFSAINIYSTIFTAAKPKYFCNIYNGSNLNEYIDDEKEICDLISGAINYTNIYKCEFDDTYYGHTIINDWNLICNRKALASLTQTFLMLGTFSGLFSGYFGDRYGRKKSSIGFLSTLSATMVILQILMLDVLKLSITAKYVIYCIAQLIIGASVNCLYATAYVLLLEQTTHKYHMLFSNIKLVFYIVGELLILLIAYLSRDWQIINWTIAGSTVIVVILIIFLIDESPRWLVSQGKYDEALKVLKKIARHNKKELNIHKIDFSITDDEKFYKLFNTRINPSDAELQEEKNKKLTMKGMLIEIFSNKKTVIKTILNSYAWLTASLLYYGLSLGISSVETVDPYILYIFQSIAEFIGTWICMLNDKFGRRKTTIVYLFISATVCLIVGLIPRNKDNATLDSILVIGLISIGKCMISAAFNTLYVYTSELYPTSVRNFALLFCSCIGRIGSIISPQVNLLGDVVWKPLPYLIFSITAFIGSFFIFILPETK